MEMIRLRDFAAYMGGEILQGDPDTPVTGVCTDTRKVKPGDAFFALIGERDGHQYAETALLGGAAGCVVSKELPGITDRCGDGASETQPFFVLVKDTTKALGDLARAYRAQFSIPVVGVTGSVGKTTTKDTIAAVLSAGYETLKTEGNYNNHLGVPLTLLRLDSSYEAAVIEMGMNHPGEIAYLTGIAQPTIAVITNIGDAHLENMGSRENTLRAKCEIFEGMPAGAPAVFSGDDALLTALTPDVSAKIAQGGHRILYVGTEQACVPAQQLAVRTTEFRDRLADRIECDVICTDAACRPGSPMAERAVAEMTGAETSCTLSMPALGRHMVYPMMMAAAVGHQLGLDDAQIREGLSMYVATPMRMQVTRAGEDGRVTLINDAYNANPQSMKNALSILSGIGRTEGMCKVAVLGDMLELGSTEEALHRGVGEAAAELDLDVLVAVGPRGVWIAQGAADALREQRERKGGDLQVRAFAQKEEAEAYLAQFLQPGAVLLFKGSRGMRMETLWRYCRDRIDGIK